MSHYLIYVEKGDLVVNAAQQWKASLFEEELLKYLNSEGVLNSQVCFGVSVILYC